MNGISNRLPKMVDCGRSEAEPSASTSSIPKAGLRAPSLQLAQQRPVTEADLEDPHRSHVRGRQPRVPEQVSEHFRRGDSIDQAWIAELAGLPQEPLARELSTLRLVDASVPG